MCNFINKLNLRTLQYVMFAFLLGSALWRCSDNPVAVDIDKVDLPDIRVLRLEQDLFAMDAQNFDQQSKQLQNTYGRFYNLYLMNFLVPGGIQDSAYKKSVLSFTHDKDVREAYQYTRHLYGGNDFEPQVHAINACVKRFHALFPDKAVPKRLITVTSGWNYAFAYMDSSLVLALDMYLGDTCKFYQMLRYPQYQVRKMNADNIVSDVVRGWLLTEFDKSEAANNLLSHTIFYGKLFYAIQALMPEAEDSLIIGYSGKQMAYCKTYEKNLWGYFAEKNRLYENNLNTIRELTSDGPFTGAIHKDCPPRIAMWVGWQIVKGYMKNNKGISLAQLMKNQDATQILAKSKYRP